MPHGMLAVNLSVNRGSNQRKSSFWYPGGYAAFVKKVFTKRCVYNNGSLWYTWKVPARWFLVVEKCTLLYLVFSCGPQGSVDEPLTNTCSSLSSWLSRRELRFRLRCNCWYHQPLFLGISASLSLPCSHQSLRWWLLEWWIISRQSNAGGKRQSTNPFAHSGTPRHARFVWMRIVLSYSNAQRPITRTDIRRATQRSYERSERRSVLHPEGTDTKKTN